MLWAPIVTAAAGPVIVTESGRLQGVITAQMHSYLGIPYAAPPVGALRWMPPQSFGRWHGVFQATAFGSLCQQVPTTQQPDPGTEDCLFLNIYTPPHKHHEHAVMVWIHGGGLTAGAGSEFDPTPLVEGGNVIVVTFNYRLGVLGFLAQAALDSEGHLAGNYGFMDQQFALGWVQRNIAAFGGDPSRVTIFGESAGGLSVYSQLASPLAAGLFHRAIAQSGAYAGFADYRQNIVSLSVAETTADFGALSGAAIADTVGCTSQTAGCLRKVAAATLVGAQHAIYPFIDGTLLTQTPGDAFSSGDFNRVSVMTGTNHDEYRYFVAQDYDLKKGVGPLNNTDYPTALDTLFGSTLGPTVYTQYPLPSSPPPPDNAGSLALAAAGTDGIFACTARRAMQALATYVRVYAYEFNDENAPSNIHVSFPMGAYHGADVEYLFNRNGIPAPFTPDQQLLSQAMITYWTQFAKKGNPNSPDQPRWAPYDVATDRRQSFEPPTPGIESTFATDHMCAFWDLQ